jgi:AraC family transcriptional regulator of adaptative response/methylated-DNA-[protein]-cysteine methyltransferase
MTIKNEGTSAHMFTTSLRSPWGWVALAGGDAGLSDLHLADTRKRVLSLLEAVLVSHTASRVSAGAPVFSGYSALDIVERLSAGQDMGDLTLDFRGTVFQTKIWQALRIIPLGSTLSYQQFANRLGMPTATRAVASACGKNRLALLVPCHRIVRADGGLGGYRWGIERKRRILELESSNLD